MRETSTAPLEGLALGGQGAVSQEVCRGTPWRARKVECPSRFPGKQMWNGVRSDEIQWGDTCEREGGQRRLRAGRRHLTPGEEVGGPSLPCGLSTGYSWDTAPPTPLSLPPRTEQYASMMATAGAPHLSETWCWGCLAGMWWRADGWRVAGRARDSSKGEGG